MKNHKLVTLFVVFSLFGLISAANATSSIPQILIKNWEIKEKTGTPEGCFYTLKSKLNNKTIVVNYYGGCPERNRNQLVTDFNRNKTIRGAYQSDDGTGVNFPFAALSEEDQTSDEKNVLEWLISFQRKPIKDQMKVTPNQSLIDIYDDYALIKIRDFEFIMLAIVVLFLVLILVLGGYRHRLSAYKTKYKNFDEQNSVLMRKM